jgi:integrase
MKNTNEGDKATIEWLDAQKSGTRSTYKTAWKHFLAYTGMTDDKILADRRNDKEYGWEKRVLESKQWAIKQGMAENTATVITTTARSFFAYYRVPLQFRKTEKAKLKEAKIVQEDYHFSIDDLKAMNEVADLTEKYVLLAGKSFGLRAGDFMRLTRGDLEAYISRETPISIGEIQTEKEGVKAYPFIDADAKPVIQLMLAKMTREGRTKPSDKILTYTEELQLTRVLKRLIEKAGINVGNKRVRFHCLRKFLIDHLSSYMSESKWKQIVGKKISEGAYVSTETLRADYIRVMGETTFGRQVGSEDMEKLAKKQALLIFTKGAGISESEVIDLFRVRGSKRGRMLTIEDEIETLEQAIEEKRKEKADCSDGVHCQRLINEAELASFLSQGWSATLVLPSGKVVVER